jgi:hypothetical protein
MIFVTFLVQIRRIFLKKRSLIGSLLVLVKWFPAYLLVLVGSLDEKII